MTTVNFSRHQMQTVQELLRTDTRSVPPVLLEELVPDLGKAVLLLSIATLYF